MQKIIYNLINITGSRVELEKFEKTAYKNKNEVFCLLNLLPIPKSSSEEKENTIVKKSAYIKKVHGTRQNGTYSLLVEKSAYNLKYFFNSNDRNVELEYLSVKFPNLDFSLFFLSIHHNLFGIQNYKDGNSIKSAYLEWNKFDFELFSKEGTYLHLEDLNKRIQTLFNIDPEIDDEIINSPTSKIKFFDYINRQDFLTTNQDFYEKLVLKEIELINTNYYHAKFELKFPLLTNNTDYLKQFVEENFLIQSKKEFLLNIFSLIKDNINQDRAWWNNLSNRWKDEFVRNLMNNVKGLRNKTPERVLDYIESTDKGFEQFLRLKQVFVKPDVIADLSPVFYLKNLKEFKIVEPEYLNTNYLRIYPVPLRKKVKQLNLDGMSLFHFGLLKDFVGLKHLSCRNSDLELLSGIEELWQLETLIIGTGNHFSNLKPLVELKLKELDISSSNVTDISVLKEMKSLEILNLGNTCIEDLTPLLELPNLKYIVLPDETVFSVKENEKTKEKNEFQQKLTNYINKQSTQTQKQLEKRQSNSNFDYNKSWFLSIGKYDIFNSETDYELVEGEVLYDRYEFRSENNERQSSRLHITDDPNTLENNSANLIYPVEVEIGSWVKQIGENLWYAEKVKLQKPFKI